ncbi:MAG: hypothetical protein ACOX7X_01265 [Methanosarcina flavescens]|jgi:hypothetical protein|uniref:Uncharacterized protein n=1 Tax=Methanosarcina flavescens TaxID=1715806 RepID=A0A660HUU7_9EURY|nr:hypothetical protein [Methanosarcina flavescens]AYK16120.1 hypothetical protein AOB57_013800 [Methanosarcina flavescens]NLK32268.1 hypothetical protein [Methanosarcina flavescens]
MNNEDKASGGADKSREFGVMGELLRALQKEEMEQTEISPEKIPEARITQSTIDLMTEINATLKEVAETQKSILEELRTIK